MPTKVSVLDQSPIPEGLEAGDALRNTIDLARRADELGYTRYWLAEHHGTPGLACNSPEVLIGPVAAVTKNLSIGSGGIMLPHYSPLKVAESFSMLSGLYPGRIDLGIGRAAGTSPNVAKALQRDRRQSPPDDFYDQLTELLGYLQHDRRRGLDGPNPWLLGSSPQSAMWAAELGLPYVFADFINAQGEAMAAYYRRNFAASESLVQPYVGVAVWAICADTEEEALRLSASIQMMMTLLHRGRLIPVPTVERALQFVASERMKLGEAPPGRRFVIGTPSQVRAKVEEVSEAYGADEILIVNILHSHEARCRSYELLAHEFGLRAQLPEPRLLARAVGT